MHTLPLFCPTPCMPSFNSISPMHALPLFYPTSFIPSPLFYPSPYIPSPYSIPPYAYPTPHTIPSHAYLQPILSHPMYTLPPFYPSSCTPSPYSIPAYTHPPPILFYSTPYMPSPYSIPLYACPLLFSTSPHLPPQYSIPAHAFPPNSLSHEPGRQVSPLTSENAAFESAHWVYHHHLPSLVIWSINLWHLNVCCFHSHELTTLNSSTHLIAVKLHMLSHNYHLHCLPLFICGYHTFIYMVTYTQQQTSYTHNDFLHKMFTLFNW